MKTEQTEIGQEVATVGETAVAQREEGGGEVMDLIRFALSDDVPIEKLERLMELKVRMEDRNAEMAMARALAAFQAECPPIPRVATADVRKNGQKVYDYTFAPYDEIVRVIRKPLANNGLSYRHDVKVDSGQVTVTCTLQHEDGATRTSTFSGPTDTSGGKNPLQAVGSAQSYGKRYTVTNVLGLATEADDDGRGSHRQEAKTVNDAQLKKLNELADEAKADKAAFCKLMGAESMAAIRADQYNLAQLTLKKKIEEQGAADA